MKKIIVVTMLGLFLAFGLSVLTGQNVNAKAKVVRINKKNFPGARLRKKLTKYDKNQDGRLQERELKKVTRLYFAKGKVSLVGIDRLPYLTTLTLKNCNLSRSEMIAKCKELKKFSCINCMMPSQLDLSGMYVLKEVNCSYSKLKRIMLYNTDLTHFNAVGNKDVTVYASIIHPWYKVDETAKTDGRGVLIDKECFPDSGFRKYIRYSFDRNHDGWLSDEELREIRKVDVGEVSEYKIDHELYSILSLRGIQFFYNLEELDCSGNSIYGIDLTKNTKIKVLNCSNNYISRLVLSNNTKLEELRCCNNQIFQLVVDNCTILSFLDCRNNQLTTLDLMDVHYLCSLFYGKNMIITGNCKMLGSNLEELDGDSQTATVKAVKKKGYYFIPLPGLDGTNQIEKLSCGKAVPGGIRINKKKIPTLITYRYNMFTDGKIMTEVCLEVKKSGGKKR